MTENDCACADCGIDTLRRGAADFYMVRTELWRRYGVARGLLCLACLELRLGRPLEIADFNACPVSIPAVGLLVGRKMLWAVHHHPDDSALRWKIARELVQFSDKVAAES